MLAKGQINSVATGSFWFPSGLIASCFWKNLVPFKKTSIFRHNYNQVKI